MPNKNSYEYLTKMKEKILDNLSNLDGAPSVQMQEVPSTYYASDDEDEADFDTRLKSDRREADGEFFDGDGDQGMELVNGTKN